jgi:hypothetical protein
MRRRVRRMSRRPDGTEFGIGDQAASDLTASLGNVESLTEAFHTNVFPAVILAPVWRRMLATGVVVAPQSVRVDLAEVVVVDADVLELRVPISTTFGELVKSVPVVIRELAEGELSKQVADEAWRLAAVLEVAASNEHFAHGPGQKPHN